MAYVQTVLVQIEATRMADASRPGGLLSELDQHRTFLQQQHGFLGMRVNRSVNEQGNVLLVVETRWRDDNSLVEYETREPNATGIVNKYQDLIVPNSLQVLDLEALRDDAGAPSPAAAQERIALPLLIPLGVLAFALLVIYGLSRVYLDVSNNVATPLAAAIALGILGAAWYVASNPQVGRRGIAFIVGAAVALLVAGVIFAAVHEEGEAEPLVSTPAASPEGSPTSAPGGAAVTIAMVPAIKFDQSEITLPANQEVTVRADNRDNGILHNWAAYTDKSAKELIGGTDLCTAPCVKDVAFTTPAPGEYFFRCDAHPTQMTGKLVVR